MRQSVLAAASILLCTAVAPAQSVAFKVFGPVGSAAFGDDVGYAGDVNADGYDDVIVADWDINLPGNTEGRVRVYSGLDGSILYTFDGPVGSFQFGFSVRGAGDVNADGCDDVIVGGRPTTVYSGFNGAVLYSYSTLYSECVSGVGDANLDGYDDFAVGGAFSGTRVVVYSGINGAVLYQFSGSSTNGFGEAVSAAGDVNNDGRADIMASEPGADLNGTDSGTVRVWSGANGQLLYARNGDNAGDRLGEDSVSDVGDLNGDGYDDFAATARAQTPNFGYVRVWSGIDGSILWTAAGSAAAPVGRHIDWCGDVDGDSIHEVITRDNDSLPNVYSGRIRIRSGATGADLGGPLGPPALVLFGSWVSRAGDVNGDGKEDIVIGSRYDENLQGIRVGSAEVYLVGTTPVVEPYCTTKTNSLSCSPWIAWLGTPSASATSGFLISGQRARNNKSGLLFYGVNGRSTNPFQGGYLCVNAPIKRAPVVSSNGNPAPANDCTGVHVLDMNSFAQGLAGGNPLPMLLVPGTIVDCQWWGRDPGFPAPDNTSLTNALEYTVQP